MTEDEILARIERGELSDEELDAVIQGTTEQGQAPVAGARAAGVPQWEAPYRSEPASQPTLSDILNQGAVGAGGRLLTYYKGLTGSPEERASHGETIRQMRSELPYSGAGEGVADVALSALLPLSKAPSLVSRAVRTGATMAPMGAVAARGQGGTEKEMARDAAWSAAGGAAASGLSDLAVKGLNASRGKWTDPEKKYIRDFARDELGLELRTGDLFPQSIARGSENLGAKHPYLSRQAEKVGGQIDAISQSLFAGGENKLAEAIQRTKGQLDLASQKMWEPVSLAAKSTTGVPTYTIRQTLEDLQAQYPQLLGQIRNQEVVDTINKILGPKKGSFAPNLSFDEIRSLQQSIGPITSQLKKQAATGAAEKGESVWMNKLYGATHKDLQKWGTDPRNAQAYELYSKVNDEYKKKLLPFYRNPLVSKVQTDDYYHDPEGMLKDLFSPSNNTAREELLYYLSQTDRQGTGILESLKAADRAVKTMTRPPTEATGSLGMGALMAPKLFAAQLGGASLTESSKLLPWYGGSPYLGPVRAQAGVKGGLGMYGERKTEPRGERK